MQSAVEYHRLYIPFKNIDNVLFCSDIEAITADYLKKNNITQCWFNRNISPVLLNPDILYRLLRKNNVKIVIDLDDYWNIPFGHILYDVSIRANLKNSCISQIKAADMVCVTHDYLANLVIKELRVSKHRVFIAPNAIDPHEEQYNRTFSYDLTKLFWQGSVTHHYDLKLMAEAVNLCGKKIYIAGFDPNSRIIDKNGKIIYNWNVTGNMFVNKQFIPFAPVNNYMKFYDKKGICLIPLENNKFNTCKSNLKLLEAGWSMKPVIVSGVHPYIKLGRDGKNCLFAYSRQSWLDAINYFLENPNFADDCRFQLNEDVKKNYLIDKANEVRKYMISKI